MSKIGSIGSIIGSLLNLLTRLLFQSFSYITLWISLGFSICLIGKYTFKLIQSKREVLELLYWRDPKISGAVFGFLIGALYALNRYSFHVLIVTIALIGLICTILFRIGKQFEGHIRKKNELLINPFQYYLDLEIIIPQEKLHSQMDIFVDNFIIIFKKLRYIYLVENLIDSIKFGLLLYSLYYVANWFSGIGLIFIFILALFTIPKIYEIYKEPIDQYIKLAKDQIEHFSKIAQEKLPFIKMEVS
ncbi:Reticulon-like protein [Meloidogyne graminicola]|uniref:Reticulon-like protein n=1 Tax=Meloidogyne graminicola TaxID=189291 RepID=A0A8S9ZYM8_9BILA|nr:Reticulon-like protein [Meloidogyne graminicola]